MATILTQPTWEDLAPKPKLSLEVPSVQRAISDLILNASGWGPDEFGIFVPTRMPGPKADLHWHPVDHKGHRAYVLCYGSADTLGDTIL